MPDMRFFPPDTADVDHLVGCCHSLEVVNHVSDGNADLSTGRGFKCVECRWEIVRLDAGEATVTESRRKEAMDYDDISIPVPPWMYSESD